MVGPLNFYSPFKKERLFKKKTLVVSFIKFPGVVKEAALVWCYRFFGLNLIRSLSRLKIFE